MISLAPEIAQRDTKTWDFKLINPQIKRVPNAWNAAYKMVNPHLASQGEIYKIITLAL